MNQPAIKVGIAYPQTELGGEAQAVRDIALAAEERGFDFITIYDHVLGAQHADRQPPLTGPYTERDPFHDPFTFLTYVAGLTRRLELVSAILNLPQRQTVIVAKQATDLSRFSDNRFSMGVGIGWNWVEYEALGQDFHTRGARLNEQLPLLKRLWSEDLVTFHGRFDHIERASLVVRPTRPIPVWHGGHTGPAFRRAGAWCDGFIFRAMEAFNPEQWSMLRQSLADNGRTLDGFSTMMVATDHPQSADFRIRPADEIAELIQRFAALGGTHACIDTTNRGYTNAAQHIAFHAEVMACLENH